MSGELSSKSTVDLLEIASSLTQAGSEEAVLEAKAILLSRATRQFEADQRFARKVGVLCVGVGMFGLLPLAGALVAGGLALREPEGQGLFGFMFWPALLFQLVWCSCFIAGGVLLRRFDPRGPRAIVWGLNLLLAYGVVALISAVAFVSIPGEILVTLLSLLPLALVSSVWFLILWKSRRYFRSGGGARACRGQV